MKIMLDHNVTSLFRQTRALIDNIYQYLAPFSNLLNCVFQDCVCVWDRVLRAVFMLKMKEFVIATFEEVAVLHVICQEIDKCSNDFLLY